MAKTIGILTGGGDCPGLNPAIRGAVMRGLDTATSLAVDAAERLKDTGSSHLRIMVLEVMGRHAGWVALYAGIASAADWILLPEKEPEIEKMCAHLKVAHARKGVALVIAS